MPEETTEPTTTEPTTTEPTAETTPETAEPSPTHEQQMLEAVTETNRLLGVLAEQGRTLLDQGAIDAKTQTEQKESLDSIHTALTAPEADGTDEPHEMEQQQLTALETITLKIDEMNGQNYETGWLLAFVIVFAIGFKTFFDQSTRW